MNRWTNSTASSRNARKGIDNMKPSFRPAVGLGLISLSLFGLSAGPHTASAASGSVVGHVYVNDNTAKSNTIGIFDRHGDGSITAAVPSSVATGGAGTGMVLGSQGALQTTADGKFLIAVDAGSSQISVLAIDANGGLTLAGKAVDSGGATPVSVAVHDDLVYVANGGDGLNGSNYSGFKLDAKGALTPIAGSTVAISAGANPGDVLFNADGTILIGIEIGPDAGPSAIDSFVVGETGTLTPAAGSPYAGQAVGPFGSEFSPTSANTLYVSNAHDGPNKGSVSAYTVATDGSLTPVSGSPFVNGQTGSCWLAISSDGKYVFAVNTGVPTISSYQVQQDGSLKLLANTLFNLPTGLRPFDIRLAPDGKNFYVVDPGLNMVSAFSVEGGTVTELKDSPVSLPADAAPFGIVVS